MPKIKHSIMIWARETAKLSLEEAAQKLLVDSKDVSAVDKLVEIENGNKDPSRSLLIRMSKLYHQPLLVFYLDRQPRIGDRGEDFRTLPDNLEGVENAHVDVLIRDIKARQSTVRETLIDEDEAIRLKFIGKCTTEQGIIPVVDAIRGAIKFDVDGYRSQPDYKEAFKFLRRQVEEAGIFVLLQGNLGSHHSNIGITVFRGFALSDEIAPFIVINDRDAESAWSFTLMHEMAHLILGQTGISGGYAEKMIEKFCNDVASEFMLPASEFNSYKPPISDSKNLASEISNYAFSRKLSSSHVAYRLYRRGDINKRQWESLRDFYHNKWLEQRKNVKEKNAQSEGGPNYYVVKQYKLGALVNLVQRLTQAGAITTTKAAMLLDVKPLKVQRLFEIGQPA